MYQRRTFRSNNTAGTIVGLLIFVLFFIGLFMLARGIFQIFSFLAPILLIGALLINHRAVVDFVKSIARLFKRNPVVGLVMVVLGVFAYPLVFGYLFFKSIVYRKVGQLKAEREKQVQGEFVEYEELDDEDFLELPELDEAPPRAENRYDDLFRQ